MIVDEPHALHFCRCLRWVHSFFPGVLLATGRSIGISQSNYVGQCCWHIHPGNSYGITWPVASDFRYWFLWRSHNLQWREFAITPEAVISSFQTRNDLCSYSYLGWRNCRRHWNHIGQIPVQLIQITSLGVTMTSINASCGSLGTESSTSSSKTKQIRIGPPN